MRQAEMLQFLRLGGMERRQAVAAILAAARHRFVEISDSVILSAWRTPEGEWRYWLVRRAGA